MQGTDMRGSSLVPNMPPWQDPLLACAGGLGVGGVSREFDGIRCIGTETSQGWRLVLEGGEDPLFKIEEASLAILALHPLLVNTKEQVERLILLGRPQPALP